MEEKLDAFFERQNFQAYRSPYFLTHQYKIFHVNKYLNSNNICRVSNKKDSFFQESWFPINY